jgi:hypothetical protein
MEAKALLNRNNGLLETVRFKAALHLATGERKRRLLETELPRWKWSNRRKSHNFPFVVLLIGRANNAKPKI